MVAVLVDGEAEYHSLPFILRRCTAVTKPIVRRADLQPFAPAAQIAYRAAKYIPELIKQGARGVIVLLDIEEPSSCAGKRAIAIDSALRSIVTREHYRKVSVVLKVRCYENWLIADPDALAALPVLIPRAGALRAKVAPDKADRVDAIALLKGAVREGSWNKVDCAKQIARHVDPRRAGCNSRSLRRFLRVIGQAPYRRQSKSPEAACHQ